MAIRSNNKFLGDVLSSGEIENSGTIEVANGTTLNLNASVYDNTAGSKIWLDSTGSASTLEIFGNGAAIYGAGALVMSNNANNSIVANGEGNQLSDYGTISGAGTIDASVKGDDYLRLYVSNSGVVDANNSNAMTILGDSTAVNAGSESSDYNAGLIETTGAGGLTIDVDSAINRAQDAGAANFGNGGTIDATGTGALTLENGTLLNGGLLQTTAAGATIIFDNFVSANNTVKLVKGSTLETTAGDSDDALANLFNYGTVVVAANSTLDAFSAWFNSGTVELNGGSKTKLSTLEVSGLTLIGGGTINLGAYGVITGNAVDANNGTAWLGNINNTIVGSGLIGALSGATNLLLQNNGTIDGTGAAGATLTIDTGAQTINNIGTIEIDRGRWADDHRLAENPLPARRRHLSEWESPRQRGRANAGRRRRARQRQRRGDRLGRLDRARQQFSDHLGGRFRRRWRQDRRRGGHDR